MSSEMSVSSVVAVVLVLLCALLMFTLADETLPKMLEKAEDILLGVIDWIIALFTNNFRGCDTTSVNSIMALKTAIDCTAYIHANERCVLITEGLARNSDETFTGVNTDGRLDRLPETIRRVNFKNVQIGSIGNNWEPAEITLYQIDILNQEIELFNQVGFSPLNDNEMTEWYPLDYNLLGHDDKTTKYKIEIRTESNLLAGTDNNIYMCYSTLDDYVPKYKECMDGTYNWGSGEEDTYVKCDDTGGSDGGCYVDNFKLRQYEQTLYGTHQPDCVVYYESMTPGEEVHWLQQPHKYDWAYIALGAGTGLVGGKVMDVVGGTATPIKSVKALYRGTKSGMDNVISGSKFLTNLIDGLKSGAIKQSSHADNLAALHPLTQSFWKRGLKDLTSKEMRTLADDLDGIYTREALDRLERGESLDQIADGLRAATDNQLDDVFTDEAAKNSARDIIMGSDDAFYTNLASEYYYVYYIGKEAVEKQGTTLSNLFIRQRLLMDVLEDPPIGMTKLEYRMMLDEQTAKMIENLGDMTYKERMGFYMKTSLDTATHSVVARDAALKVLDNNFVFNQTVYDMIEDTTSLNKDYAQSWARCLSATPGNKGKALCVLFATAGTEMMYRYNTLQTFTPVGINSLGYYKPFEDEAEAVALEDEANFYYVELDRVMENIRFYLASPCTGRVYINHTRCECNAPDSEGSGPDYPNYFIDMHDSSSDSNIINGMNTPANFNPDGNMDVYESRFSIEGLGNKCTLDISELSKRCIEGTIEKASILYSDKKVEEFCNTVNIIENKIGQPIKVSDMRCLRTESPQSTENALPEEYAELWAQMAYVKGVPDGYKDCGVVGAPDTERVLDYESCWDIGEIEDTYMKYNYQSMPASVGAYVDKKYAWPGVFTSYTESTYFTQYPMVFPGTDQDFMPEAYAVVDEDTGDIITGTDDPLDTSWNNLVPLRMAEQDKIKMLEGSNYLEFSQAYEANINLDEEMKAIPSLTIDQNSMAVKECLSKENAESEWDHDTGREGLETECLQISVVPYTVNDDGDIEETWDPNGYNYCYHDKGDGELKLQVLNAGVWMTLEWGATAVVAGYTGAGAVAAKPAIGFITGAASEYTSQYIAKNSKQVWPGHPN